MTLTHNSEIAEMQESYQEKKVTDEAETKKAIDSLIQKVTELITTKYTELVLIPIIPSLVRHVASLPDHERDDFIKSFEVPLEDSVAIIVAKIRTAENTPSVTK